MRTTQRGFIAWMAGNPVAANLLMLFFLLGGLITAVHIKQEVFPEFTSDMVTISVPYPGASPEEVEQGIILAIEERLTGLDGVKEITSSARESSGTVTVEALSGTDIQRLAQDVKSEVDRITSFPEEAETPKVVVASHRRQTVSIALYGNVDERSLRNLAEIIRDELLQDPEITQVDLSGVRDLEISVEISQDRLRAHGLTLREVADKIGKSALELPGGSMKTSQGEILVRLKDRRELGQEFAKLPIITTADGSVVRLEDLGTVTDGFADTDISARYNNQPAVLLDVYRVGEQTPNSISAAVTKHMERLNKILPPGVHLAKRSDSSDVYRQRMDLLIKNGISGLILVFALLALFLEIRLAFYVSLSIPVSILGAFLFLPAAGVSINMISMFALIVTLGIVVDNAVVVGENIYQQRELGLPPLQAAISGTQELVTPVTFAILTNLMSFAPMLFIPGALGRVFGSVPIVVIFVFLISLVQVLYILPAHLGHQKSQRRSRLAPLALLQNLQERFSDMFMKMVRNVFGPLLMSTIRFRYLTLALAVASLCVTAGYVGGGHMGMVMFPKIEADYAYAELTMPFGSPPAETEAAIEHLVRTADELAAEHGGSALVEGIFSQVGTAAGGHTGSVRVFLAPPERRSVPTTKFTQLWRERAGEMPGIDTLKFEADRGGPGSGASLTVELSHQSTQVLEMAGEELARILSEYEQVSDIDDGFSQGKIQFDFKMLPQGMSLGLTAQDVARQIRAAFYGAEALRQQRGRNEIKVMVRLPKTERTSLQGIENFLLRTPQGSYVPLREVVTVEVGRSYTSIERRKGRRVISVTGDVTPPSQAGIIQQSLQTSIMPRLAEQFPGLTFSFEGRQADIREGVDALMAGLGIAVLGIFVLLAVPLRSYTQPLIIMVSIPFGIVGAVLGHLFMGYSMSLVSLFGIVALAGVVVNASLVLIDCANGKRLQGQPALTAIHQASIQRFRPILLTTITTFGGLAPMIWETSRQARFLIPMALSLGFGILFATFITLAIVPSLYMILEDLKRFVRALMK
jgi:multidrug efflux pump subunit AcrB